MNKILLFVAAIFGALCMQGCLTNISDDPHYDTGYIDGHVYRLVQDLPGVVTHDIFQNVRAIRMIRSEQVDKFVGETIVLISRGTEIVITSVYITKDIENGKEMNVQARIASGSYKGKYVVIKDISKLKILEGGGIFSSLQTRDPKYLEEKMKPNQSLQHNDPGCHASCLRTPRASRDRG
jgi:hypothetical protein